MTVAPAGMTTSFDNAAQVLTPPEPGLAYLRSNRANEIALEPGGITVEHGRHRGNATDQDANIHVDATGCTLLPGLVDCHTHLPFAGWRAGEYEQKVTGVPYEEIARAGGGIASSARALRETPTKLCSPRPGARRRDAPPARPRSSASPATASRPPASCARSSSPPS